MILLVASFIHGLESSLLQRVSRDLTRKCCQTVRGIMLFIVFDSVLGGAPISLRRLSMKESNFWGLASSFL
jgi:hypothetical protein